jgi:hypothetical protein
MSFQAYLDKVEALTGKTPNEFIALAKEKQLTEHKDILAWLKNDFGLGLGHARALAYVILHGPKFTVRQTTGPHRDESDTLVLTGRQGAANKSVTARKTGAKAAAKRAGTRKASVKKTTTKKTAARRAG